MGFVFLSYFVFCDIYFSVLVEAILFYTFLLLGWGQTLQPQCTCGGQRNTGLSPLTLPCGSQTLNPGFWAWPQVPLPLKHLTCPVKAMYEPSVTWSPQTEGVYFVCYLNKNQLGSQRGKQSLISQGWRQVDSHKFQVSLVYAVNYGHPGLHPSQTQINNNTKTKNYPRKPGRHGGVQMYTEHLGC